MSDRAEMTVAELAEIRRFMRLVAVGDLGALGARQLVLGTGAPGMVAAVDDGLTSVEVPGGVDIIARMSEGALDDQPRIRLGQGGILALEGVEVAEYSMIAGPPPYYRRRGDFLGAVTVTGAVTGTSFTLLDPASNPVRFKAGSLRLIVRGAVYIDGDTYGTYNTDTTFTFQLAEDGYTVTFAQAPGGRPLFLEGLAK